MTIINITFSAYLCIRNYIVLIKSNAISLCEWVLLEREHWYHKICIDTIDVEFVRTSIHALVSVENEDNWWR